MPGSKLTPPAAPKKMKRKRQSDPSWNNRFQSNRSPLAETGNLLAARSDTSIPTKTAILIDEDAFESHHDKEDLKSHLEAKFAQIPSRRPIAEVIEVSTNGSPTKVKTPSKTILTRVQSWKAIMFYLPEDPSFTPDASITEKMDTTNQFRQTAEYKNVQTTGLLIKQQEETITKKNYETVKIEQKKQGKARSISQNQVMAKANIAARFASATLYLRASGLFASNVTGEWLHLIQHAVLGKLAQNIYNLGAGTEAANTHMMYIEHETKFLVKRYAAGVKISVDANLVQPQTEILGLISYQVKTNDFSVQLTFNGQTVNKPFYVFREHFHQFLKSLSKPALPTASSSSSATHSVFFKRAELLKADAERKRKAFAAAAPAAKKKRG